MAEGIEPASSTSTAELTSDVRIFLLAEVRDYTRFSQERGDEEATRLVERFARLARLAVEMRAGKVIELRGDEALAVFGSPRQALRAAVELQARYTEETQRDPSLPLRVGIGLDAGEAVPFEGGYRGRALNLAARLKDQARAGQVLATEAIIHLAGQMDGLAYAEQGLVHPKGFALPVHVIQVVAEGSRQQDVEYPVEPELRTFLFADIRGFRSFVDQYGDLKGADLQTWYAQFVEERVRAHGGRLLDLLGDDAQAVFVSPRQAIQAAVDLQEQFQQVVERDRQVPLTLGIGVEAGEAIPLRGKYVGSAVHLAATICGLAGTGEVLLGETVSRLVRKMEGLSFVDRREAQVRGYADPVRIIQVVREEAVAREESSSTGGAGTGSDIRT